MLLQVYTKAQVGYADFRSRLHSRLVEMAGSERGGVAAEYALLISLIAIVIVVGAFYLGTQINNRLNDTGDVVQNAPATGP